MPTNIDILATHNISGCLVAVEFNLDNSTLIHSISINLSTYGKQQRLAYGERQRLEVYSAPSCSQDTLQALTVEFIPVTGWNTVKLITPALLDAGTYFVKNKRSEMGGTGIEPCVPTMTQLHNDTKTQRPCASCSGFRCIATIIQTTQDWHVIVTGTSNEACLAGGIYRRLLGAGD